MLRMLVKMFEGEGPRLREEVRRAVAQQDAVLLHRMAHTLKGALNSLGATPVAALALELETMGCGGDFARAPETFSALEDALGRLETELNQL